MSSNFYYAITQIVHNFGACALVGGSLLLINTQSRKIAWIILFAWALQGLSGASFGLISYLHQGNFPEITKVAKAALFIKMLCTALGFFLTIFFLRNESKKIIQYGILACSVIALTAAAFLRWFS